MKTKEIEKRLRCRGCDSQSLTSILSLGNQYVSSVFAQPGNSKLSLKRFPLELMRCNHCGLVQLRHTVLPDLLYRHYWYRSGVNNTMRTHLSNFAEQIKKRIHLKENDVIVDIGANDGTFLQSFFNKGLSLVGFEPSQGLHSELCEDNITAICDYFSANRYWNAENRMAKVITSIAMFYDIDNPNLFAKEIAQILDPEGYWIIEMRYLPSMLTQNAFDNICHEHLTYYSFKTLKCILDQNNLSAVDVELNEINGGSFRVWVTHKSFLPKIEVRWDHIQQVQSQEDGMNLDSLETYRQFAVRVKTIKEDLHTLIRSEVILDKKILVYGASTKGNVILQYCELDSELIGAAVDKNPEKWGTKTIGTNIPIISESEGRKIQPDYFLILPWHFLEEFTQREHNYLKNGGKFIVPLPEPHILDYNAVNYTSPKQASTEMRL